MERKQKMDDLTKMKLVFSGELMIFAIIFFVLGTLRLTNVIGVKEDWRRYIFPIITLAGCTWFVIDLIWAIVSKKHREKSSLLDKSLVIPSSLLVIAFDIYVLIKNPLEVSPEFFRYFTGSLFLYFGAVYVFLSIYHYFKPIKYLVIEYEKLKAEEEAEQKSENENKEIPQNENLPLKEENKENN